LAFFTWKGGGKRGLRFSNLISFVALKEKGSESFLCRGEGKGGGEAWVTFIYYPSLILCSKGKKGKGRKKRYTCSLVALERQRGERGGGEEKFTPHDVHYWDSRT